MKEIYDNIQIEVEKFLSSQNIDFESEKIFGKRRNNILYIPDLYLPKGGKIGDITIPAKACIELKKRILQTTIVSTYNRFQVLKKKESLSKLYLIYDIKNENIDENIISKYTESWNDFELIPLSKFIGNINSRNVEYANWVDERDNRRIPSLVKNIRTNNATLFLGAGVSQSAHLPSWKKLLEKLCKKSSFVNLYESDIDKITDACHNSNLITVRYLIQKGFKNNQTLEDIVHEIFYKDSKPQYSDLMKSIVGISKKQQIKSIITYNYDDLIDQNIPNARPIYGNRRISNASEFPIYHVHGYIPQQNMPSDSSIVLSEERYHEKYREAYDWSNVEQLHALTHSTCLFIGLSMSDPNIRRLLDFAKSKFISDEQDCPHYAFLKRTYLNGCNMPCGEFKNREHIDIQEKMFADLGINVIWYEDHDDLPDLINSISSKF